MVFKTRAINHSTTSPWYDRDHEAILAMLLRLFMTLTLDTSPSWIEEWFLLVKSGMFDDQQV